jgi:Flp pilus assembly protein TadD
LIKAGVTGIAGHVAEPFLDATIRPEILFPAYVAGFNLVESYYLAMPYLSWQTVVVGDPLCAPFPRPGLPATALDPAIDPASGLPAPFTNRRFGVMMAEWPTAKPDALKLLIRSERRLAQRDVPGAKQALEEATTIDPALTAAHRVLATLFEQTKEYDKAIERYQRVLDREPNDIIVLNNMAYGLAARQGKAAEARPLAERAYTLSRGAPLIADTLGWVFHLLGDRAQALKFMQQAVNALPKNGEVRYHYAAVLAAAGDRARAAQEMTTALELDPTLKSREDVMAVHKNLSGRAR